MASLTRWVLAHKRIVVAFWLILTLIGMASAGSATKALKQKYSVPGKEGFVTNQQISHDFGGTGGNGAPLLPVVTLPAGSSVSTPATVAQLRARRSAPAAHAAGQPHRRLREHAQLQLPLEGWAHDVHRRLPPRRPLAGLRRQPQGSEKGDRRAEERDRRRRAGASDRLRCADRAERRRRRHRRALRGAARRLRRAARAGLRVRVAAGDRADHHGDRLDPHDVPRRMGPDDGHRNLPDRAVLDRADRPRRLDRLRADRGGALA